MSDNILGRIGNLVRANVNALIDGADSFDPSSFAEDLLAHLVWVRCTNTPAALHATDPPLPIRLPFSEPSARAVITSASVTPRTRAASPNRPRQARAE